MFRTDPASKYSVLHIVEIIPGREVFVIDPALQVTQPELKGKHQGHPPWVAQQHESSKPIQN